MRQHFYIEIWSGTNFTRNKSIMLVQSNGNAPIIILKLF